MLPIVYGDVIAGRDHQDRLGAIEHRRLIDEATGSGRNTGSLAFAVAQVWTRAAALRARFRRGARAPISPAEVDRGRRHRRLPAGEPVAR